MAIFFKADEILFEPHPKFEGVKIAKLAGKEQGSVIGVSILSIQPGVEIPVHIHDDNADSIYCLEGSGEIYCGGHWKPFGKGDYCLVPPKEEHGVKSEMGQELKLFIVHSPPLF